MSDKQRYRSASPGSQRPNSGIISPRDAVAFIWDGQERLFEIAYREDRRTHFEKHVALDSLAGRRFFAPLARTQPGSSKSDVAPVGNVLWSDIDSRDAPKRIEGRLVPLGLQPSLLVDSGNKGYWCYLKLTHSIPTEQIESLNRRLAALLDGDHCWNRDRIARLPGSIHPESGRQATVEEFTGILHDPETLDALLPADDGRASWTEPAEELLRELSSAAARFPSIPILSARLLTYIRARPRKGGPYDRSALEHSIFKALIHQGWADGQILAFADVHLLARHSEERLRYGDYRWTLRSLTKIRAQMSSGDKKHMCIETVHYPWTDRYEVLKLVCGQNTADTVREITKQHGCSARTARRALQQLKSGGYVTEIVIGREKFITLTPKGLAAIRSRFRPMLALTLAEEPFDRSRWRAQ